MTVTNLSSTLTLNDFDSYVGYPGITLAIPATGGQRKYPLPYPFGHVVLAPSANKQLPVHAADFRKQVPWTTMAPSTEWNQVVQAGLVSVTIASETGTRDIEDKFLDAV